MKHQTQLVIESAVIGLVLLGIVLGGSISISGLQSSFSGQNNPNVIPSQYNLTSLALFYNQTLTQISENSFKNASASIQAASFQNYPSYIAGIADQANGELASMNYSLTSAHFDLNESNYYITTGLYTNASQSLLVACSAIRSANSTFSQFQGPITNSLGQAGVQISLYSIGASKLQSSIIIFSEECNSYSETLSQSLSQISTALKISSPQTQVLTGGLIQISGSLLRNGTGVPSENISFYANSTYFGSVSSKSAGSFSTSLNIPYLYGSTAAIWATVGQNSTSQVLGALSNTLYLKLLYNQTIIVVGDPPTVYPTFSFTVQGHVLTKTGSPLINVAVRITSFNSNFTSKTDSSGLFTQTLTVPADATDGIHYIYASFASSGTYGPSQNFTSIEVARLPLQFSVNPFLFAFSGTTTSVSGKLSSNGSAVSNAIVTIETPWGNYHTQSNGQGSYDIKIPIPLFSLVTSSSITVVASPEQAYIASNSLTKTMGIFNSIGIGVPVLLAAFGIYEIRNLDLLPKRKAKGKETIESGNDSRTQALETEISEIGTALFKRKVDPKIITPYIEALALASRKFGITFAKSTTIQETIELVKSDNKSEGSTLFSKIALMAEDYLYGREKSEVEIQLDEQRIAEALSDLKKLWS